MDPGSELRCSKRILNPDYGASGSWIRIMVHADPGLALRPMQILDPDFGKCRSWMRITVQPDPGSGLWCTMRILDPDYGACRSRSLVNSYGTFLQINYFRYTFKIPCYTGAHTQDSSSTILFIGTGSPVPHHDGSMSIGTKEKLKFSACRRECSLKWSDRAKDFQHTSQ